jgi:hypothetical protein
MDDMMTIENGVVPNELLDKTPAGQCYPLWSGTTAEFTIPNDHCSLAGNPNDSSIDIALRLYQHEHPEEMDSRPLLTELIDWLLSIGGYKQVTLLEERIGWIHNSLVDLGEVDPDGIVALPGSLVTLLKILTDTS